MTSIKIKDESGNWIVFGGTAQDTDLLWTDIATSTFYVPAVGGNFTVSTANDPGYVFGILPTAPDNGTIARIQAIDNANFCYFQPTGTDTIEYQAAAVLARNNTHLIESVRYYNGRWLRIDGNATYVPPPLVGPYGLSSATGIVAESSVLVSGFGVSTSDLTYTTMSSMSMLTYP